MTDNSAIEWTDATWNPIRGCSRVSAGCMNCYAEGVAQRFSGPGQPYEGLTRLVNGHPTWTGKVRLVPEMLDVPLRWQRPRRIFVNSMSDLFHEKVPDAFIDKVFAVMALARQHTFQVLTKRPERMRAYLSHEHREDAVQDAADALAPAHWCNRDVETWPLSNVWLGVSVEDQAAADERIPLLLQTPAAVRWLSVEPLLGPVTLPLCFHSSDDPNQHDHSECAPIPDWVVVGGESGPRARPMHPDWARSLRDQCVAAGVPFFFKQWGAHGPCPHCDGSGELPSEWPCICGRHGVAGLLRVGKKKAGRLLDGREWNEYPEAA